MKSVFQILISLVVSSISFADGSGVAVELDLGRSTQLVSFNNALTVENTASFMDLKVTYAWPTGIYAGGKYATLQNISITGNDSRAGLAVVVGYRLIGFYTDFSYFLFSSLARGNGYTYDSGSSYSLTFGYNMTVISSLYLGVGVVFNSFSWTQSQFGGNRVIATNNMTDIYPSLNIGYNF